MEIDEVIWKNLIPTEHQLITVEEFPAIKSPLTRRKWMLKMYTFLNGVITFLLNVSFTTGLYLFSCTSEKFHEEYSNHTETDV